MLMLGIVNKVFSKTISTQITFSIGGSLLAARIGMILAAKRDPAESIIA